MSLLMLNNNHIGVINFWTKFFRKILKQCTSIANKPKAIVSVTYNNNWGFKSEGRVVGSLRQKIGESYDVSS